MAASTTKALSNLSMLSFAAPTLEIPSKSFFPYPLSNAGMLEEIFRVLNVNRQMLQPCYRLAVSSENIGLHTFNLMLANRGGVTLFCIKLEKVKDTYHFLLPFPMLENENFVIRVDNWTEVLKYFTGEKYFPGALTDI